MLYSGIRIIIGILLSPIDKSGKYLKIVFFTGILYMERVAKRFSEWIIILAVCGLGIVSLGWWFTYDPTTRFLMFIPGMDGGSSLAETDAAFIEIGEFSRIFDGIPADLPGAWARFRGAQADNIYTSDIDLSDNWGDEGPEILWKVELGEGHAAPAVMNGRVYVLDYDEERKADALRCFSLADGREIWRRWYTVHVKRNHGMSRTIPAVNERYAVTIGPRCHVMCVDSEYGSLKWGLDLQREFGTKVPLWYAAQCPLIDGNIAVIAPCGDNVLMIGVDCETGKVVWETPNHHGWEMSHSSIMPMTLNGKRMYVYFAIGGIAGVSAEEDDRGTLLWETTAWSPLVVAPSPVILGDGRIFLTAGYGAGSMMLKVTEKDGVYTVKSLYELRPRDGLACEQHTPVLYKGHLFGVLPKDAGEFRNELICFHPDGKIVWTSGKTNKFGLGPFMIADDKLFILSDDGILTMAEADTEEFIPLARAKVLNGRDSWGPLAIAGGRMLLRDSKQMVCIDVAARR